jgi:hypothetical protein
MGTKTLLPNRIYKSTASTTITKTAGGSQLEQLQISQVGAATAVAADTQMVVTAPLAVSYPDAQVVGSAGEFTLKSGANVNARRIVNTTSTIAAPSAATDGHSTEGASRVIVDMSNAVTGAITWQFWTYSATSGLWVLDSSLGTAGSIALAGGTTSRTFIDIKGCDRVDVIVSVNGSSSQVNGWATGVP